MCFSVQVDVNLKKLAREFSVRNHKFGAEEQYRSSPMGYNKTDKLIALMPNKDKSKLLLREPYFSLVPPNSKVFPNKIAHYNARMDKVVNEKTSYIYEKYPFKSSFKKGRFAIVPVKAFCEYCYWGDAAGSMVEFSTEYNEDMYLVALYDVAQIDNQLIESLTLLTDVPYKYVLDHGHNRSPISIHKESIPELLKSNGTYIENFDLIRSIRIDHSWKHKKISLMKDGWQKRAESKRKDVQYFELIG